MKLSEFLTRIKMQVPNMNQSGITDSQLTALINQACDQVNLLAKVYQTYTDFDIEADKRIYNLSTIAPTYLGTVKKGLLFKNSDDRWEDIYPTTESWIAKNYPDYLNADSADIPDWYWIEGDELGFYPAPSTAYTKGARLFHLKKAEGMTTSEHYPFSGSTTQVTALLPLDDAIVAYVKWKISPAFGKVTDEDLRETEFLNECRKGAMQIKRRLDLTSSYEYGIKI